MGMSNKKQQIPAIRFRDCSDAWEQRKVFDMSEITFGGGTPKTGNEDYWQGNFPWIQSSDLKNDQLCNVIPTKFITDEAINKSATKAVPANSIAVVTRVGVGKLALMPYPYATSQDFLSLSNLKVDPWFGVYSLYVLIQKEINNIQGTSIKGMTKSDLLSKNIHIPFALDEQTKIGNFFKQLDDTIALHQRQLENYSQLKNAMIQKIFNKELRFKNENGNDYSDWEKKRLGEILAEVVRKSTKQDQHVILSSTNKGLFLQSEYFISNIASADNIGYKIMRKSEIVFSPQNLWMGNINYNDKYEIGLVSPSYKIFAISEEVIPKFMKYMIKTPYLMNEYLLSSEQGASVVRRNLDMDLFNKILVEIPSLPEQHQIASFLAALDCNIDQLTRKIELLKDKKKGLLQLMFI